jgi:hypothetical protein
LRAANRLALDKSTTRLVLVFAACGIIMLLIGQFFSHLGGEQVDCIGRFAHVQFLDSNCVDRRNSVITQILAVILFACAIAVWNERRH